MGKYIDLTGKKFYDLTVIKRCGSNRYGALWECKCECGNTVIVRSAELNNGSKKSCGCTKFFDRDYNVTGQKFGRLLVIDDAEPLVDKNGRNRMVLCRCDCGNFVIKKMTKVVNGEIKSCGCLAVEKSRERGRHHMTKTRIHNEWSSMLARCGKKRGYEDVTVCGEWRVFENFYEWSMNNGYSDNLTLDRIDPYGNYEPGNCRWTDNKTQQNNKRNNRYFVINGERHTMKEWAEIYGIPYYLVKGRVSRGYDIEKALTPVADRKQKVRVKETGMVYESQSACARDMGINQWNISRCLLGRATEVNGYHFERVVE